MIISKSSHNIDSLQSWEEYAPPKGRSAHWVDGRSAKELARAWVGTNRVVIPPELINILNSNPRFQNIVLQEGYPECRIIFDSCGGECRNADLAIKACCGPEIAAITIEAKSDEPLDSSLDKKLCYAAEEKINNPRSKAVERIIGLVQSILPLRDKYLPGLNKIRYQMLTGIAGTIAYARGLNSSSAIFIIHEFHTDAADPEKLKSNARDMDNFMKRFTQDPQFTLLPGVLYGPYKIPGKPLFENVPDLYIGKIIR